MISYHDAMRKAARAYLIGLLDEADGSIPKAAEIAGIRAILVYAISEAAKRFYENFGFVASPVDPLTVMITIAEAVNMLGKKDGK